MQALDELLGRCAFRGHFRQDQLFLREFHRCYYCLLFFFYKNKCFYANFIVKQKLPVVGISLALRGAYNQKQLNTRYTLVNKRKPYLEKIKANNPEYNKTRKQLHWLCGAKNNQQSRLIKYTSTDANY